MGDKKLLKESFRREQELLHLMVDDGENNCDGVADQLSNLCLRSEEVDVVMYGPLREPFYTVNCPFVWSEYISRENIEAFIASHKEEIGLHDNYKTFSFHIYFAFLCGRLRKMSDAFEHLKFCEEFLSENACGEFFKEIMSGLNHALESTRAHLTFLKGDAELADEIISKVVPLKELDKPSKAALIALNAEVLMAVNPTCKEVALEMMQMAVKLDPDEQGSRQGAWYYTVGKLLGQLRRMEHRAAMPSREELQMLERATKMNSMPVSLAALADSYRDACSSANSNDTVRISQDISSKMLSEAKQLYKKACEQDDQSYSTLRRCGNGLMKLPPPYKDLPLAKQCLEKAIALHPKSASAYQALGTMEEKYSRNLSSALKYYQLSYDNGNPISASFIVQVRKRLIRNYNPIADLDGFIEDMDEERQEMKAEFLILKGEYIFFYQKNLLAAAKAWKEAISFAPESENVMNHMCRFLDGKYVNKPYIKKRGRACTFNLYECLEYEIRDGMGSPKYTEEDKNFLKELLNLCVDKNSEKS